MKKIFYLILAVVLMNCASNGGGSSDTSTTTSASVTNTLQGKFFFPGTQNGKPLKIFISNSAAFGSPVETLTFTTTNTIIQSYSQTFASKGNYFVAAWVDVDSSGTLTPGDYYGWYNLGSNTPGSANMTLASGSNTGKDFHLSTHGGSGTTATITVTLPGVDTGKSLYLFIDNDAHLGNGATGVTRVTTNGTQSYAMPIYNVPAGNYYVYAILDATGSGGIDTGNIMLYRGGANANTTPTSAAGLLAYTMGGNSTFTSANNIWLTPSAYSVSGTITLPSAQPTKTCVIKYDLDNNLANGYYFSTSMPCGSSTTVNFTSPNVPTANYFVYVEALTNINAPASGDYTGYVGGTGTSTPPGATTLAHFGANSTGVNVTPTVIP